MDTNISAILRPRSSNRTFATKTTKPELMTSVQLNKKLSKKRGVYVEKKSTITKVLTQGKPESPRRRLSPKERDRRRHVKPKLDSSTSTISIQIHESDQKCVLNRPSNHQSPSTHRRTAQNDEITEYFDNLKEISRKSGNFRAKYLKNNMEDVRPISVLYSKRCITQTPSVYSQLSCRMFDEGRQQDRKESLRNLLEKSLYGNVSDIENAVLQGLEFSKNGENRFDPENKTSKDFYEYFTSLLDDNVENYNTDHELSKQPELERNSSAILIIDETDTETDSMGRASICPYVEKKDVGPERNDVAFITEAIESTDWNQDILEYGKPIKTRDITQNRVKRVTFGKTKHSPIPLIRKINETQPKEKKYRKTKSFDKKTLLEILKEQIKSTKPIEEPRNMYQALQRIAKNRGKSQKYDTKKFRTKVDDRSCMTPVRRNLLLLKTKPKQETKNRKLFDNTTFYNRPHSILRKSAQNKNFNAKQESMLSLQVFEIDNNEVWPTDGLIAT